MASPSAAPTARPLPTPSIPPPPPSPTPLPPVAVWEGQITLDTYGWEQALVPTSPEDPIYPYPRLNFDAVGPPAPRSYRAVFVENEYVQLVVVPDLGGRILRWTDRTTGRQLFYANPAVKPTRWGYRGWWLATGGMEWAFPVQEHGLNEYRPWQYEILWNGVRVWDIDDRTGMRVEVSIQVDPGTARVRITPRVSNVTEERQQFQFWANAMLVLSDFNAPSADLTFILPVSEVIVHASGDGSLPGPGAAMPWPVCNGRDLSRYAEWGSWMGIFAPQAADAGFAGAYDPVADQGIVRVAPTWVRGVKIFGPGDLPAELWTDDGSRYFELWGGLTPTFWHSTSLDPGESVAWTETWYAVAGTGGFTWANEEIAARVTPLSEGVDLAVSSVRPLGLTVVLYQGSAEAARWEAEVAPGQPFRASWGPGSGPWGMEVFDAAGTSLLTVGQQPGSR